MLRRYPPFFPNQKPFESDDDFFVRTHAMVDLTLADVDSIIDRRRAWFQAEVEANREEKIAVKYYTHDGWSRLPAEGLSSLTPYAEGRTQEINYPLTNQNFAQSGRAENVAALFEGHLRVETIVSRICLVSDDGSKLFIDDELWIDHDGIHSTSKKCAGISPGLYKVNVEYFERAGGALLILEWGGSYPDHVVPARSWISVCGDTCSYTCTHNTFFVLYFTKPLCRLLLPFVLSIE